MPKKRQNVHPYVPYWIGVTYGLLAVITIPWATYLAVTLPEQQISFNWDVAWAGFDIGLSLALAATALLAIRRSRLLVMSATITATLLLVDAWFDIVTSSNSDQLIQSVVLALLAELPLAVITYRLAYVILSKELRVSPKPDFHI